MCISDKSYCIKYKGLTFDLSNVAYTFVITASFIDILDGSSCDIETASDKDYLQNLCYLTTELTKKTVTRPT